jgi:hypothetical protein
MIVWTKKRVLAAGTGLAVAGAVASAVFASGRSAPPKQVVASPSAIATRPATESRRAIAAPTRTNASAKATPARTNANAKATPAPRCDAAYIARNLTIEAVPDKQSYARGETVAFTMRVTNRGDRTCRLNYPFAYDDNSALLVTDDGGAEVFGRWWCVCSQGEGPTGRDVGPGESATDGWGTWNQRACGRQMWQYGGAEQCDGNPVPSGVYEAKMTMRDSQIEAARIVPVRFRIEGAASPSPA